MPRAIADPFWKMIWTTTLKTGPWSKTVHGSLGSPRVVPKQQLYSHAWDLPNRYLFVPGVAVQGSNRSHG